MGTGCRPSAGGTSVSNIWNTPTLAPDSVGIRLATADFSKSPTDLVFIRLTVKDASGKVLGDTLYWHNRKDYMRYEALNTLPEVSVSASVSAKSVIGGEIGKDNDRYTLTLTNKSSEPAVQTRIRTLTNGCAKTIREDVLPAFYSDNYFPLMPGESKTVTVEFNPKYLKGCKPVFELSGWNTAVETINRQ